MTNRDEILRGRVRVGRNSCYGVSDRGKSIEEVSFIFADGSVLSCCYSQLHFSCSTDSYLSFEFTKGQVSVKGRNLAKISRAISEHRLIYLAESKDLERVESREPLVVKMAFSLNGVPLDVSERAMLSEN